MNGPAEPAGSTDVGQSPFIWDAEHGMRNLEHLLSEGFGVNLAGWDLHIAYGGDGPQRGRAGPRA